MPRTAIARSVLLAVVFVWAIACSDGGGPGGHVNPLLGLIVSPPVAGSAGTLSGSALGPTAGAGSTVVFISLAPGSVPTGLQATIRDQATGLSLTTAVVDGGFDPVAISATIGDTLLVDITRTEGNAPFHGVEEVRPTRPPVVVRTSPPSGGHDVPLNANVLIVFGTPIDSATLSTASIQLWRDTTPVPGTVRLSDSIGFRVEFRPDSLLAGETVYDLLVTRTVHDLNGGALAVPLHTSFATGVNEQALEFSAVSVAGGYTCALTTVGAAYCWGVNSEGELGTATNSECGNQCSTIPVPVAGGLTFQSVSLGLYHACGLTTNGTAYCWGSTNYGQLGTDTATIKACFATPYHSGCPYPVPVAGGHLFKSISPGQWHTCGVTTNDVAYCWGRIDGGALGADSVTLAANCQTAYLCLFPVPVSGGLAFASISAGNALSCGITTTGATYCWGSNAAGQLGIGTANGPAQCIDPGGPLYSCSRVPIAVASGLVFTAVAALDSSACGLATTGSAYCWGYNGGLLGTAVPLGSSAATPVRTGGTLTFTSLAAGLQYACGVTSTGAAFCWGVGDNGVFGSGTITHISTTPVQVAGGHGFQTLGAATGWDDHTCGLTTDGIVYCWGGNVEGELGDGSTNPSTVPVKVTSQ